jgi:hypothetical protein
MSMEWQPVVGYEALYEVSEYGCVQSKPRTVRCRGDSTRVVSGRVLKPTLHKHGVYHVTLSRNGKTRTFPVGKLVLEAFVGPQPDNCSVKHGAGGKNDDRCVNLWWG